MERGVVGRDEEVSRREEGALGECRGELGWLSAAELPDGETDLSGAATSVDLSALTDDPGDHHVCRLAIASGAAYLFTHDRGYLRSALQGRGVEVTAPDSFLTAAFDEASEGFLDLLERQAADWAGGRPINELLTAIERAGAEGFAGKAHAAFGL